MSIFTISEADIQLIQTNNWRLKKIAESLKESSFENDYIYDLIEDSLNANYEVLDFSEPTHVDLNPIGIQTEKGNVGIFIGHNKNTGASSIDGTDEFISREKVGKLAIKKLKDKGYNAFIFYRDKSLGYTSAMKKHGRTAKQNKLDVSLELHFNCYNGSAYGAEILVSSESTSKTLGEAFKESTKKYYSNRKLRSGGVKLIRGGRGYGFNKYQPCPSGVYEPFFADNEEWYEYDGPDEINKEAEYVCDIINNFFKKI